MSNNPFQRLAASQNTTPSSSTTASPYFSLFRKTSAANTAETPSLLRRLSTINEPLPESDQLDSVPINPALIKSIQSSAETIEKNLNDQISQIQARMNEISSIVNKQSEIFAEAIQDFSQELLKSVEVTIETLKKSEDLKYQLIFISELHVQIAELKVVLDQLEKLVL